MLIKKAESYKDHTCILKGIDEERQAYFNAGEEIEITEEEFNLIGYHRWLEVINECIE